MSGKPASNLSMRDKLVERKPEEAKTVQELIELVCLRCSGSGHVPKAETVKAILKSKWGSEADFKALNEILNDNVDVIEDFHEIILTQDKWIDRLEDENKNLAKRIERIYRLNAKIYDQKATLNNRLKILEGRLEAKSEAHLK